MDRERYRLADPRPDRPRADRSGVAAFAGRVVTPTARIAIGSFLMVQPQTVLGAETEGGAGTFSADAGPPIAVYFTGPVKAGEGDLVICRFADWRWVADRHGGKPAKPQAIGAGCPCSGGAAGTAPVTAFMNVVHPELNQNNFNACTLVYQPTPAAYTLLSLGANNWFSNETFLDFDGVDHYRYVFRCEGGFYILRKVYVTSIFGSPHLGAIIYRWLIGFGGNQCEGPAPSKHFQLLSGQIFTGGDPTTVVTIT